MFDPAELPSGARAASAPASAASGFPVAVPRRYRAFISYSHADTRWANWLMRKLEGYRVPQRFHGRAAPVGEVGPRLAPVFRDRDELPTTSDLGETIRAALRESATLIVICSPNSAKSRWVLEEIKAFKRLHGERRVFAFIVAGEPKHEGATDDCFSPALRRELGADGEFSGPPAEVVAADARTHGDGKGTAFLRLVSGLLGVGFDELRQRELQRRNRRLTLIAATSAAGMVLTLGLAFAAWRARGEALVARNEAVLARNDAQRRQDSAEDVLSFMLGDFREDLKKVGQLPLLEKVGNKAQAYFDAADPRDLTDTALTRQAKALSQIGEVKLLQKDVPFAEAEKAFTAAYRRAAELSARHPRDGDMIFERAQSEFWIGNTHLKRKHLDLASEWLGRYRDSAVALVALDPRNATWQRELISGHHNLAVLELERRNFGAARAGFLAEIEPVQRLLAGKPDIRALRSLQFKLTDIDSFLGTIAMLTGEFAEARRRFAAQRAALEELIAADPANAQWQFKLADCLIWEMDVLEISGQIEAARDRAVRGETLLAPLVAKDPSNRRWGALLAVIRMREAAFELVQSPAKAMALLVETVDQEEQMIAAEPKNELAVRRLMYALRLTALLRFNDANADAQGPIARALAVAATLSETSRANDRFLQEFAQCLILAGRIFDAAGRSEAARESWLRAVDALGSRAVESNDYRILDPLARALTLLGRSSESSPLFERLRKFGYVPPEPWPPAGAPHFPVRNLHNK